MVLIIAVAWAAMILVWCVKCRCQSRWNPSHLIVLGAVIGWLFGMRNEEDDESGPLVKCMSSSFSVWTSRPFWSSQVLRASYTF
jgi:hypothetical protein